MIDQFRKRVIKRFEKPKTRSKIQFFIKISKKCQNQFPELTPKINKFIFIQFKISLLAAVKFIQEKSLKKSNLCDMKIMLPTDRIRFDLIGNGDDQLKRVSMVESYDKDHKVHHTVWFLSRPRINAIN